MKIMADSNILFAAEAFSRLGNVALVKGRDITRERLGDVDILLVRSVTPVNRELLEKTPVKYVACATTGIDHVDTAYLRENHIGFSHAPGSNAESVAEYVISALAHCAQKKEKNLGDMTLGIIGVGNVGSRVARLAQALGMRCLLNDPPKKDATGSESYLPLSTVLKESDIVTIHVPLCNDGRHATFHMAHAGFISSMKKGAFLVNASRGDVADETALKDNRQRLGCVIFDVWSNEPNPDAGTIALCDIATPHIAGHSYDGKLQGTRMIYESACAFYSKEIKWHPPEISDKDKPKHIKLGNNDDAVNAAIRSAYPIMEDDKCFRKIVSIDDAERGVFFDDYRNNYPKRFEFCNHTVTVDKKVEDNTVSALSNLGFKVITKQ
jgi:erythronate-4-phosphate dehydrogenase